MNRSFKILSLLVLLAMLLAACAPAAATTAPEPTAAPAQPEPTTAAPAETTSEVPPAGQELVDAYAGKYKGTVVTMAGPFTDNDAVVFEQSIKAFEDATGIDIQYSGSKEFEANIGIQVDGGNPPDIADFPQPGLLATQVRKGKVIPVDTVINPDWLKENYAQSWLDMATMTDDAGATIMAGIWARFNAKSVVWYPKKQFDAAGYTVPTTWEELMTLSDQIADDGDTPWCIGIESGAATGWPMTDWMEDMMLRTTSAENYDKWVRGELKFNSPEVKEALSYITKLWFDDKYVYGGRAAITTTNFGDSPKPMFEDPPKCWMHRQGNFVTTFFPEGLVAGEDYDFFYLPPVDPANKPFLVAGDIYAMFNDRPEVRAVFQYFSTGESLKGWMAAGGALAPYKDASLDWYGSDIERKLASMVAEATTLRFDASDLMPGAVGSGSFWKKMTDYVSGNIEEEQALQEIDEAWPAEGAQAAGTGGTTAATPGQELTDALAGKYTGTVVTMAGPFTDNDAVVFEQSIKDFEDKTGIDIQYSGSKEFEANIGIQVDGGNPPDIADFPQPGLLATQVRKGKVIPVDTVVNPDWLKQNYAQSWLDMATMTDDAGATIMAGIWARFNAKSVVWYPKKQFDAAGYTVPTTWEELMTLSDQIADDGDTPWCIGIESGAATGWPMTDWMEDMMLRTTSAENYDKWVRGELKFNSPEVKEALSYITKLWFDDKYVYGGRAAITTTNFGDSPKPMFEDPPKCWMHRQGNFVTTFFPEGLVAGEDYDFFYLPPVDPANKPFLVAGDIYAMFNDRPEVRAVFQYFSTGESLKGWMAAGGALAPYKDASLDWYGSDIERKLASMVAEATTLRFDASDLMPGAVGSGSFWKKMTDYVSGNIEEEQALQEIDEAWPAEGAQAAGTGGTTAATPGQELTDALAGKYTGTVVTMAGPFTDNDAVVFEQSIKDFEDKTGIDIQYSGSKEFEANIGIQVDGGNPPDIADFPQPGLLATQVRKGKVIPVDTVVNPDWLKQNYAQSWLDMAMKTDDAGNTIMAGIWARFNAKSVVWYPKKQFDAAGYTVPTTWEELMTLSDQIADDGDTPWCIGIESGAATGWPMTDWMEDMMLRTTSAENYDKWVSGELDFNSPEVKEALSYITKLWFDDKYVYGGRAAITTTNFGDSPKPMFEDPPKCWMHRQGNFVTTFFPEGLVAGEDYDFFYLPPVDPANKPFLVAGDIYAMFNDRPEVRAVFQYFSTGESLKGWMAAGGALAPYKDASLDWYGSDIERKLASMVAEATTLRFDASDLMPGAVGSGSFWKKMTDYVSGNIEEEQALQEIDASWPAP